MAPTTVFFEVIDQFPPLAAASVADMSWDEIDLPVIDLGTVVFWDHLGQDIDQLVITVTPPPSLTWDDLEDPLVAVQSTFVPDQTWIVESGFSIDDLPFLDHEYAAEPAIVSMEGAFWSQLGQDLDQDFPPPVVPSLAWDDFQETIPAEEISFSDDLDQDVDQVIAAAAIPDLAWDDFQDTAPSYEASFSDDLTQDLDQQVQLAVPDLSWDEEQHLGVNLVDRWFEDLGHDIDWPVAPPAPPPELDWLEAELPLLVEPITVFWDDLGDSTDRVTVVEYFFRPDVNGVWVARRRRTWGDLPRG